MMSWDFARYIPQHKFGKNRVQLLFSCRSSTHPNSEYLPCFRHVSTLTKTVSQVSWCFNIGINVNQFISTCDQTNIARCTTDPGYWVYNLSYLFDCIEFVFILATEITQVSWHHLHYLRICPLRGATCISCKFGHQGAPLALPHCLRLPFWLHQLVLGWYLHQPGSHQ